MPFCCHEVIAPTFLTCVTILSQFVLCFLYIILYFFGCLITPVFLLLTFRLFIYFFIEWVNTGASAFLCSLIHLSS